MSNSEHQNKLSDLCGKSIVLVSTVPFFLVNQLSSHIENLKELGVRVTLVTSAGHELACFIDDEDVKVVNIEIARAIKPWQDIKALYFLTRLFRQQRFSIMHSTTPKAGILSALAARLAGIPIRLHTFTGQVWVTKRGMMRWLLQKMDQAIIYFNTHCYTDSPSQRNTLIDSGITDSDKVSTYGKGSLAGVDLTRFSQKRFSLEDKQGLRSRVGIKNDSFVLTFIGRLTRDKGIYELLSAFRMLRLRNPNLELMILGPLDDATGSSCLTTIESLAEVHWLGYVQQPEEYLAITDLLCLPSYREGFGTVVIEAAAMGVPCVGARIPGLVDAIEDGVTGLLVPPRDVNALAEAMESLMHDRTLLEEMSAAAASRCEQEFDSAKVNNLVASEYARWLGIVHS